MLPTRAPSAARAWPEGAVVRVASRASGVRSRTQALGGALVVVLATVWALVGCGQPETGRTTAEARNDPAAPPANPTSTSITPATGTIGTAAAPRREAPARWVLLPARQREALAPLEEDWPSLTPDQRQKWVEVALRFPTLSESERERIQDRMTAWSRLTPAERGQARWAFQETRPLAGAELDERWRAYRELNEADRLRLAEQARRQATPVATLRRPETSSSPVPKTQVVNPLAVAATAKPAGPTIVAAPLGATTAPVGRPVTPPAHQQAGQPKIVASRDFVDTQTLLPRVGPQVASPAADTALASPSPPEPSGEVSGETPNSPLSPPASSGSGPTGPNPSATPAGGAPVAAGSSS